MSVTLAQRRAALAAFAAGADMRTGDGKVHPSRLVVVDGELTAISACNAGVSPLRRKERTQVVEEDEEVDEDDRCRHVACRKVAQARAAARRSPQLQLLDLDLAS